MSEETISTKINSVTSAPPRGQLATERRYIPNVPVINHLGQEFEFYEDLVKDRVVILHLMSIHHDAHYPVARNLSRVQGLLGQQLGMQVFIHSITTEPQTDSVDRLRMFARRNRAKHGWQFLTGDPTSIQTIRDSLFIRGSVAGLPPEQARNKDESDHDKDCSRGLLRYGNDVLGLWGSVPGKTDPKMIVERISWLLPQTKPNSGRLVRRGPFPNLNP